LAELSGLDSVTMLKEMHAKWLEEALKANRHERDHKWSQAIAIGSEGFIAKIKKELGMKVIHRQVYQVNKGFELREDESPYNADFAPQNAGLSHNNNHLWNVYQ
jgi:REP-associated tyrosine transposase